MCICLCVYICAYTHTVKNKIQKPLLYMNILSKKQIIGEQGNFKLDVV